MEFSYTVAASAAAISNNSCRNRPVIRAAIGAGSSSIPATCPTLYDILAVSPSAGHREIRTAYRRLARQFHPDVVAGGRSVKDTQSYAERFIQIQSAYAALTDPQTRALYDQKLSIESSPRGCSSIISYYTRGASSTISCTPSGAFPARRGRSWETDQCWC